MYVVKDGKHFDFLWFRDAKTCGGTSTEVERWANPHPRHSRKNIWTALHPLHITPAMADIDYEQQNRIRIALGLKPLPVPGATSTTTPAAKSGEHSSSSSDAEEDPASTLETRQAAGYDNWKKVQDEAEAKKRRVAKVEAIKKARDAAQKYTKLQG